MSNLRIFLCIIALLFVPNMLHILYRLTIPFVYRLISSFFPFWY